MADADRRARNLAAVRRYQATEKGAYNVLRCSLRKRIRRTERRLAEVEQSLTEGRPSAMMGQSDESPERGIAPEAKRTDTEDMTNSTTTRYRVLNSSKELVASCFSQADAEATIAVYARQGWMVLEWTIEVTQGPDNRW